MRIYLISFLMVFICIKPLQVSAQDDNALPGSSSEIVSNSADDSTILDDADTDIFSQASDENIIEAQRFFKYCSQNPTLNKEKDCKCAATRFLETRVKLGDDVEPDQIMAENRNTCLKTAVEEIPKNEEADTSKYSEADILEAEEVYEFCESKRRINMSFDCECLAAEYLEIRHVEGPVVDREMIFLRLQTKCKNLVDTAGHEYSLCMSSPTFKDTNGIERKEFCECYARRWALSYGAYSDALDRKSRGYLKYGARAFCSNPKNYP